MSDFGVPSKEKTDSRTSEAALISEGDNLAKRKTYYYKRKRGY